LAASNLGVENRGDSAAGTVPAHFRRQDERIARQTKEIATLKREVARLSRH
jgi:hypothetical protein